jgi:hypothetical protein
VEDLVSRLDALDPDAGAAVRVIAYFDQLIEGRAGLEAIVRGAAALAECPARLVDDEHRLHLRVMPDGRPVHLADLPQPSWPHTPVGPGDGAVLWLERPGPVKPVEAMVLERAAAAIRTVLSRTRGRAPVKADDASVEVIVDPGASPEARLVAARTLGLAKAMEARAVALEGGSVRVEAVVSQAQGPAPRMAYGRRAGVGPAVPVLELPDSCAAARMALRLTAEGTDDEPGPRTVYADQLGALVLLAQSVGPETPPIPDELALEHAAAAAPWMLSTLHAVATGSSLRGAAAALRVHHSTLQERISHAERLLGWSVREPDGRLRLHLALALRTLRRHPAAP